MRWRTDRRSGPSTGQIDVRTLRDVDARHLGDQPAADAREGVAFEAVQPSPGVDGVMPDSLLLLDDGGGGVGNGSHALGGGACCTDSIVVLRRTA